tara:strand:- start:8 stop:145 length:138 start_codon:yes stop_codon:yes gene_type:complete
MKTFKQFQEELTSVKDILKKLTPDLKKRSTNTKPFTQEPGKPPKF